MIIVCELGEPRVAREKKKRFPLFRMMVARRLLCSRTYIYVTETALFACDHDCVCVCVHVCMCACVRACACDQVHAVVVIAAVECSPTGAPVCRCCCSIIIITFVYGGISVFFRGLGVADSVSTEVS